MEFRYITWYTRNTKGYYDFAKTAASTDSCAHGNLDNATRSRPVFEAIANVMYRDCKSDTADVISPFLPPPFFLHGSRRWNVVLTAINMSTWNISGAGSDVLRIILVIGIREGTLGPSMISQMDSLAKCDDLCNDAFPRY